MSRGGGVHIRALSGLAEYAAALDLQEATWGEGFSERVPTSLMKVAQRTGGVASGAFSDAGTLVGFVFGITGVREGRPVHWSDMLAVAPTHRGRGIGQALKRHQRDAVRVHGVRHMYWTADPLEAGNAHLNLNRLGAEAVEYLPDFYGPSDSPLHAGLGTDRVLVRWALDAGPPTSPPSWDPDGLPAALGVRDVAAGGVPRPGRVATVQGPAFRVPIPARIQEVKAHDVEVARAWRQATRSVLEPELARGGRVDAVAHRGALAWLRVRRPGG